MERWNTHWSTSVNVSAFDHDFILAQNPSSQHLGTTVWDASIALIKFLEKSSRHPKGDLSRAKLKGELCGVDLCRLRCGRLPAQRDKNVRASDLMTWMRAGKRAIELGSGMGLGAIGFAMMGCDVVATDTADVLDLLKGNIEKNLRGSSIAHKSSPWSGVVGKARWQRHPSSSDVHVSPAVSQSRSLHPRLKSGSSHPRRDSGTQATVQELDWLKPEQVSNFSPPYDFIAAADCVYHETIIEHLVARLLDLSDNR